MVAQALSGTDVEGIVGEPAGPATHLPAETDPAGAGQDPSAIDTAQDPGTAGTETDPGEVPANGEVPGGDDEPDTIHNGSGEIHDTDRADGGGRPDDPAGPATPDSAEAITPPGGAEAAADPGDVREPQAENRPAEAGRADAVDPTDEPARTDGDPGPSPDETTPDGEQLRPADPVPATEDPEPPGRRPDSPTAEPQPTVEPTVIEVPEPAGTRALDFVREVLTTPSASASTSSTRPRSSATGRRNRPPNAPRSHRGRSP